MSEDYHLGLLHLTHLLVSADGVIDNNEVEAIRKLRKIENIPDAVFHEFESSIVNKKEREIYETGIKLINSCTEEEKLKTFVALYKISEVDGHLHVKEVRLLLYSIKMAGVEFDDVVKAANNSPSIQ
jgi:uncharacterized tellurite resistance protein B-like protein